MKAVGDNNPAADDCPCDPTVVPGRRTLAKNRRRTPPKSPCECVRKLPRHGRDPFYLTIVCARRHDGSG
jgi:hypothetical protein